MRSVYDRDPYMYRDPYIVYVYDRDPYMYMIRIVYRDPYMKVIGNIDPYMKIIDYSGNLY